MFAMKGESMTTLYRLPHFTDYHILPITTLYRIHFLFL